MRTLTKSIVALASIASSLARAKPMILNISFVSVSRRRGKNFTSPLLCHSVTRAMSFARSSVGASLASSTSRRCTTHQATDTRRHRTASAAFGLRFPALRGNADVIEAAKAELLCAIEGTDRGLRASDETKAKIDALATKLERLNPNPKSLKASCLNGEWELVYTTSASILGTNKPALFRPRGPIYQTIDTESLRAKNRETAPFYNAVEADLTPTSVRSVNVSFRKFLLGGGIVKVNAPERARGALDITFVDDDVRVSRGDKGNLFVLVMHDKTKRLPREN